MARQLLQALDQGVQASVTFPVVRRIYQTILQLWFPHILINRSVTFHIQHQSAHTHCLTASTKHNHQSQHPIFCLWDLYITNMTQV